MVSAYNYAVTPTRTMPQMRSMVVEITNALMREGYHIEKALLIAVGQAETWADSVRKQANHPVNYHVTPHPAGWVVRQPNNSNPCLIFRTREEAIELGKALAQDLKADLIIHKDSGEIQSKVSYQ